MSYRTVAKILPRGMREGYKNLLTYSGVRIAGERFLGFTVVFGLVFALTIAYTMMVFMGLDINMALLIFLGISSTFELGIYMMLWLRVQSRTTFVENILPDALQIMSMNIRAGLTTERALILTARPEFGILERELKRAGKEILAGKDLKEAMGGISKRIKSRQLETTLKLIVDGIKSGGELASLLEQTASDIRNTAMMEKEVKANVLMYVIFIFFAVGLGAPLIFGISTHLVEVLSEQMGHFEGIDLPSYEDIKTRGVMPFGSFSGIQGITSVSIDPEFLVQFALMSMMTTSFFGGLIIGIIKDGEEKHGMKYIPILMVLSVVIFFVTRVIAATVFAL